MQMMASLLGRKRPGLMEARLLTLLLMSPPGLTLLVLSDRLCPEPGPEGCAPSLRDHWPSVFFGGTVWALSGKENLEID